MTLAIDIVSDVVCPWCFIGKRHLDRALRLWHAEQPQSTVAVRWHPFFLDPDTPQGGEPYRPYLEKKFGGAEKLAEIWQRVSAAGRAAGIEFAFEKIELRANTLNAHRLIHHAQEVGACRPAKRNPRQTESETATSAAAGTPMSYEIVGPVCESGDFLGHDRRLALNEGDLLAILSAGAYGMSMASNYNSRPRAAEVMIDGAAVHLIRRREEVAQLFALESTLP